MKANRVCVTLGAVLFALSLPFPQLSRGGQDEEINGRIAVATKLHSEGKSEEASSILEALVRSYPKQPEAYLWLGRAEVASGQLEEARDAFRHYADLSTSPKSKAEGYRGIARTHLKENDRGLAETWYRKAKELQPDDTTLAKEMDEGLREPKKEGSEAFGFFNQGLFGICGGRSVWWGWVLGLVLYVPALLVGSANSGRSLRAQYEQMNADPRSAAGAAFFMSLIGAGIGFIIFWGLPGSVLAWCLLGTIAMFAGGIASATVAQA